MGEKMITSVTIRLTDDQLEQLKGKKGQPTDGKATPWLGMTPAATTGKFKMQITISRGMREKQPDKPIPRWKIGSRGD